VKPTIGITIGDPAGIGPEIAIKAALSPEVRKACRPVLVGPGSLWSRECRRQGLEGGKLEVEPTAEPRKAPAPGRVNAATGSVSAEAVVAAAVLCMTGKFAAMATAPISKKAVHLAGYRFPGHTELLAGLAGADKFAMMFVSEAHKVILATIHEPVPRLPSLIKPKLVLEKIRLADLALRSWWGIRGPRIAVLGLNPHAGEDGLLGAEERESIVPAVTAAARGGIRALGPVSAEAGFRWSAEGKVDALVAMYHDQGLLPLKALGGSVNVTLGLPFVRTSPDHGTALDIAGKGTADPGPMIRAVLLAAKLANRKLLAPRKRGRRAS
jgi:4-hydroxythreonine-4-phosphate dehydrogenase